MSNVFAQEPKDLGTIKLPGLGAFFTKDFSAIEMVSATLNIILSNIFTILTISAALWFIFRFIIGGYMWLSAGGNPESVQNAQKTITNAIVGFIIVIAAFMFISLIGALTGIDILNPQNIIPMLGPKWKG